MHQDLERFVFLVALVLIVAQVSLAVRVAGPEVRIVHVARINRHHLTAPQHRPDVHCHRLVV